MDREEILKRSRAEKEDEGSTFLENRGRRAGVAGFCSMFTALLIFNFLTGQPSYSIHALFWCYISLEAWGKYRVCRQRGFLVTGVLAAVSSLCFLDATFWRCCCEGAEYGAQTAPSHAGCSGVGPAAAFSAAAGLDGCDGKSGGSALGWAIVVAAAGRI